MASTAAEALATQLGGGTKEASGTEEAGGALTPSDLLEALELGMLDTLITDGVDGLPAVDCAFCAGAASSDRRAARCGAWCRPGPLPGAPPARWPRPR